MPPATLKRGFSGFIHAAHSWLKTPGPWAKLMRGHRLTRRGQRKLDLSEVLAEQGEADINQGRRLTFEARDELRGTK